MKSLSTFIKEARNQNLMFTPSSSSDFKKLVRWLDKSPYHADVYRDYVIFPEDDLDALEMELDKEFVKLGIDGYFEAVYESVKEAADYNKQPLKVGDSVEVIDYDDAVGKIVKLDGNSATVEIKSGTYAGKSKHETKNLVKL